MGEQNNEIMRNSIARKKRGLQLADHPQIPEGPRGKLVIRDIASVRTHSGRLCNHFFSSDHPVLRPGLLKTRKQLPPSKRAHQRLWAERREPDARPVKDGGNATPLLL